MKLLKHISAWLWVLPILLGLSACSEEEASYSAAPQAAGTQVYFPESLPSVFDLSKDGGTFEIQIYRGNTEGDVDIPLTINSTNELFTIENNAHFKDGESIATITIRYDGSKLEYDDYSEFTISVGEGLKTPYGTSSYSFSAGVPAPWVSMKLSDGTRGFYREDNVSSLFSLEIVTYPVEVEENALLPGKYRIVNPYGSAFPHNVPGDWDNSKDYYLEIDATDPEFVHFSLQDMGVNWGYGSIGLVSYVDYLMMRGQTLDEVKAANPDLFGKLKDGIITFPAQSILISMGGSVYYGNPNGMTALALPGYQLKDYTSSVAYAGKYIDKDENTFIHAAVELGKDVENAKVYLIPGELTQDIYNTILEDKDIEGVNVAETSTSGEVRLPLPEGTPSGKCTLVIVSYAEESIQGVDWIEFMYQDGSAAKETWTDLYVGNYTYTLAFADYDEEGNMTPYVDEGLVLSQSNDDPTRFKISNWGNKVDFIFIFKDGGVYVLPDQETGATTSTGMIRVCDLSDYEMGSSSFDPSTNTFTFAVYYYDDKDGYGYGEETFTITGEAGGDGVKSRHAKGLPNRPFKPQVKNIGRNTKKLNWYLTDFTL